MNRGFDYYRQIENPNMYLCNPNQKPIGCINANDRHLVLRFNDLSELTFTVPKIDGTEQIYNQIESKRLVYIDDIGWFEIISVDESIEGCSCEKSVTAESHQAIFKNRGFVTEERVYMFYNTNDPLDEKYDSYNNSALPSVVGQLHKQLGIKVAIQNYDINPTEDYKEWTLTYIDPALKFNAKSYSQQYESAEGVDNICRSFKSGETYGYDFMVNDAANAFNVVFEFDFLYHAIKVRYVDDITKPTSIYLSFDNVLNSLMIKENAEDIVTVLSCNGTDLDIRTVNPMGTNYIVDFDYYKKRMSDDGKVQFPWMSERLISALDEWQKAWENWQSDDASRDKHERGYSTLVEELQYYYSEQSKIDAKIQHANLKLSDLLVARDQYLNGDDEAIEGAGIIVAESVAADGESLLPSSDFSETQFNENSIILAHKNIPNIQKISGADGEPIHYEFRFDEDANEGEARSMILDYIDGEDINNTYLYFTDDALNKSYCKLTVASEVGVVKDVDGFIAKNGAVSVRGNTFDIDAQTEEIFIRCPDGSTRSLTRLNAYFNYNNSRYRVSVSADGIVTLYCFYVSGFDRYTTYTALTGDAGWCSIWEAHITSLDDENAEIQVMIDGLTDELEYINEQCNVQRYIKKIDSELYNELLSYWIEGSFDNDNFAAYDTTTMAERIEIAKQLMKAGQVELSKVSQPTFEMSVEAVNFINLFEFKSFTNELNLGRVITIEKDDDTCFYPALVSIEYDLDDADSFALTFSNGAKPNDTAMTYAELIKEATSTSRTIAANWSNLMDYSNNKDSILNLIAAPLDRTLRAAQANMSNQQFTIDTTGILGRKWSDDSHTSFMKEQMRLFNNSIIFTDDNWDTASLALGKINYGENGETAYGLIADVLVGNLLLGKALQIVNENNTITLDNEGIAVRDRGGELVFEAKSNGGVFISANAMSDVEGNLTNVLRQEFIAADGKLESTITDILDGYNSRITQNAQAIVAEVSARAEADTQLSSKIEQTAEAINISINDAVAGVEGKLSLYVAKDDKDQVVSMLNASANEIVLESNRLSIESDNFKLSLDGTLEASNANISGTIAATAGVFGGLIISDNNISSGDGGITFSADGIMLSKQIEASEYISAPNIRANYIGGIFDGVSSLEFVSRVEQSDVVTASIQQENISTTNPGLVRITVNTNITLTSAKAITIAVSYYNPSGSGSYKSRQVNVIIPSGKSSAIAEVPFFLELGYKINRVNYTPMSWTQDTVEKVKGVVCDGNFYPKNTTYNLGTGSQRWNNIYAYDSSIISTSDVKEKNSIEAIDEKFSQLFDLLKPVRYTMNNGTSGRQHIGLIANEVKYSLEQVGLNTNDFAGYCEWKNENGESSCGLRYGEFIGLCIFEIQKLKQEIMELKSI